MMLADVNVWLALTFSAHKFHRAVQDWWGQTSPQEVLFCRATQQSFLRLVTTAAVCKPLGLQTFTNQSAWQLYQNFLADSRIKYVPEPDNIETRWLPFAALATASPKVWMDSYLAAFAMTGSYQLVTTDNDFKQFAGLNALILSS
jgi:uncharacterized protein